MKSTEIKAVIYTGFIDTLIGIELIEYGIDDIVKFRWYHNGCYHNGWDRLHKSQVRYDRWDRPYFYSYHKKWYLDEAMETDSSWIGGIE